MVQRLPAKAIIQGLELEYRMLQNDLEFHRYDLTEEAKSILYFREFIYIAKFGSSMYWTGPFLLENWEFYRQTVIRLIEANELPSDALEKFDDIFVPTHFHLAA
jgi:hypothetical protein